MVAGGWARGKVAVVNVSLCDNLFPPPNPSPHQKWKPKLADSFLGDLAEQCVGYCGADLKALCTEAGLLALRRTYPQVPILPFTSQCSK